MSLPGNLASAAGIRLGMAGAALGAAGRLAVRGGRAWMGDAAGRGARIAALLGATDTQRQAFALLRAVAPNLALSRRLVAAYDNTGTVIVTRHADVTEVLERESDFAVVYEPKMRAITAGENFFLGMQDSAAYTRDVAAMRLAMRREDVPRLVLPFVAQRAEAIVAGSGGRLDMPQDLTLPVLTGLLGQYFGTPGPSSAEMAAWTTRMFWYLFVDLRGEEAVTRPALAAAEACRGYLDGVIAARRAAPAGTDQVLDRCLALQAAGVPGMDDLGIRNNLIGLLIGLVPTLSKACVKALDGLLDRPVALAAAQAAARADDDAALAALLWEALRFDPVNPFIYRRAVRETVIARGTLRARRVPEGTMVLAANLSAMHDPIALDRPQDFRAGRGAEAYMLWGYGMHTCFGAHINQAVIPQMLKPLLRREGLRRAGPVDGAGTPFPVHFPLAF
ncbi:cytochrome P450 [Falsiroseomonas selenitidurans]|uniref:Cytochrome P450 n=1 Tax=Falsiroseomonas selenitidurans TaxID=2716335 RepID=A0ABX1E6P8_9PROT|nr:cytochrome P450 [Falsiroseomonas selenitidurans]NKC32867.1 cytochrome P450 [Falsiroseomonas selenitidurans]